ncbi:MAG: glycosyltransferase [Desulfocapsaceae bacterium]
MQDIGLTLAGARFCLCYPDELAEPISLLLRDVERADGPGDEKAVEILREGPGDSFRIVSSTRQSDPLEGPGSLLEVLPTFLKGEVFAALESLCVLSAAALATGGRPMLFPGIRSSGKSMLAAYLVSRGWQYRTDECVCLAETDEQYHYLATPPAVRSADWPGVLALLGDRIERHFPGSDRYHVVLNPAQIAASDDHSSPSLIIFPRYASGVQYRLEPLSAARAAAELMRCAVHPNQKSFQLTASLTRNVRCLRLTYGDSAQLEHLDRALNHIADTALSSTELEELLASFQPIHSVSVHGPEPTSTQPPQPIPAATPAGPKKLLTIGMATYDDYDGVYFTVQAIRLYHPEVTEQTEILVIDNNPEGPAAQALKNLDGIVANYRYVPFGSRSSTAVRDLVFRQANGDFVLCLDGHVLVQPGALQRLIEYLNENPESVDLLQGPMYSESLKSLHTHFESVWSEGMYGRWGIDERAADPDGPPFEIAMQGLGLFGCRKAAWVGFNPRFRGFGGEEGYIHEKFRQRGGRTLCLPFLRWLHRFARPAGVPYKINWHDRIFNYLVGLNELGLDTQVLQDHFKEHLGEGAAAQILSLVEKEMDSPFFYFDAIYCITKNTESPRWEKMHKRLKALGIEASVRISKAAAMSDKHIHLALSHRSIISEARQQGLDNVLVFEDDTLFLDETVAFLTKSVAELKEQQWNLFYLGGNRQGQTCPLAAGCRHLSDAQGVVGTHAIAYGKKVFNKILSDLPDSEEAMTAWLDDHHSIDHYLQGIDRQFLAEPSVATQIELLPSEKQEFQKRFTLGEAPA